MINATTLPAKHKVKIVDGCYIHVDGVQVGRLEGRGEIYVILGCDANFTRRGEAVARFKRYLRKETARTLASRWVKHVLARVSWEEVVKAIGFNQPFTADRVSPLKYAENMGYTDRPKLAVGAVAATIAACTAVTA